MKNKCYRLGTNEAELPEATALAKQNRLLKLTNKL